MTSSRPTRAQTRDRHRLEWLCEREDAQTVPCPDCHAPSGSTCTHPTGQPLVRAPAHPGRIRARRAASPPPEQRSHA
ncbi:hypothetical protein ACL02T_33090 [Pseudonocardia sp. RS010]|uniref:zinc finger domain-containing protein n=1 Tax=Pseudonocardia sp. RS010 TaxID=3385979 RepID=UPI0039A03B55